MQDRMHIKIRNFMLEVQKEEQLVHLENDEDLAEWQFKINEVKHILI